jgi:hypothetical protein
VQVLISYRRTDAKQAAGRLAETLKTRLGPGSVFIDSDIEPGTDWRDVLVARVRSADVVLALIGGDWAKQTVNRDRRLLLHSAEEDVLRLEMETAYEHGVPIIPVLVDHKELPPAARVARPFRPLLRLQRAVLDSDNWSPGVDVLIERINRPPEPLKVVKASVPALPVGATNGQRANISPIIDALTRGRLVTFLGPEFNAAEPGVLDDAHGLARKLAGRRTPPIDGDNLAWVSQRVAVIDGPEALRHELGQVLHGPATPTALHRFVAALPRRLRSAGLNGAQLIVTMNYDDALERAFDEAGEPYDLAVFIAEGEHRGKFAHVHWWEPDADNPTIIDQPNGYVDFPFDGDGEPERTVIVKLCGGRAELGPDLALDGNFVVTEDDFIGFLSEAPITALVPNQILGKIRRSFSLFLSCPLGEWPTRVYFNRLWADRPLGAVIAPSLIEAEQLHWTRLGVSIVNETLAAATDLIDQRLAELAEKARE